MKTQKELKLKDTLTWTTDSINFPCKKGEHLLEYYHPSIGHWSAGKYKNKDKHVVSLAIRAGMEIGMRKVYAELQTFTNQPQVIPGVEGLES